MNARLRPAILVGSIAVIACAAVRQDAAPYDVVIVNGRVIDPESGLDAVRNIGISGGKIAAIADSPLQARTTLDATGLVIAPGFIDLHQHRISGSSDGYRAADGVTTALELEIGTADADRWYAEREGKALINFGVSAGHIPSRMAVMHDPGTLLPTGDADVRTATADELQQILELVDRGLRSGALAVGLGPAYTRGATNWEILEVFRIAARHGVSAHVHIRGSVPNPAGDMSGLEEALAAAAATGAALHVVHIQSTSGGGPHPQPQLIVEARARGMDVTTEAYPYDQGATQIGSSLFDRKENEPDAFYATLLWPATGERLIRESFVKYRKTGGSIIFPTTTEEHVRKAVAHPLTAIASDGAIVNGKGHPRTSGTYARVLGRYVREQKALTLVDALRKMTLMPAQRLEKRAPLFKNKGRIRVGADADIAVFDPQTVIDRATYQEPTLPSEGFRFVLVNGVAVVNDGKLVENVFPGRAARAP